MYVDKWFLHEDGCLEAHFRDNSGMKIVTTPVTGIDEMQIVTTHSGCAYVIGEPLYLDIWPADVPAKAVNQALYSAILQFQNRNLRGDKLWEIFQDELATVFVSR
jgi:hypothetical protein